MSQLIDEITKLLSQASEEERRALYRYLQAHMPRHSLEIEWNTTAEEILTAIARSSDLTLRGIRGILAEAIFEKRVVPILEADGWESIKVEGDRPYDFLIGRGSSLVRIQIKLQRRERGEPKEYRSHQRKMVNFTHEKLWVVEVQKTRSGERSGVKTRPYRFGDFDILAVNLHPSTSDWQKFMYTVDRWLIPRAHQPDQIEIFQPVPAVPDKYWTDDLQQCIGWLMDGDPRRLYSEE